MVLPTRAHPAARALPCLRQIVVEGAIIAVVLVCGKSGEFVRLGGRG